MDLIDYIEYSINTGLDLLGEVARKIQNNKNYSVCLTEKFPKLIENVYLFLIFIKLIYRLEMEFPQVK